MEVPRLESEPEPVSIVTPAHNEEGNVRPLVREIAGAIDPLGIEYEIVIVDDGSTDGTPRALRALMDEVPRLRVIRMTSTTPGRGNGQSAAFHAGFRAARFPIIATLDADLQNDPADLLRLLELLTPDVDVVQGDRSTARTDGTVRRLSSHIGRLVRRVILGDTIRDTGCSLRVLRRPAALALPLELCGMHRFIPFTARRLGYRVVEVSVSHRPRTRGRTKYGIGNRAVPGLLDCLAVRWMRSRHHSTDAVEITPSARRRPGGGRPVEIDVEADIVIPAHATHASQAAGTSERRR